jgi:hypothetical protein
VTPLFAAVSQDRAAAVRILLAHGARPLATPEGRSLRDVAREKAGSAIQELLDPFH